MTERFRKTVLGVVEHILCAARADAQLLSGLPSVAGTATTTNGPHTAG